MSDLRNSLLLLFGYIMVVLGIAQIQYIEDNVLDFSPLFFVLFASAIFFELLLVGPLLQRGVRISIYLFLTSWAVAYGLVWFLYWRPQDRLTAQILLLQFILVELAAGLAYEVARNLGQVDKILEGLTIRTYPNRALDIHLSSDRIQDEFTRSRRYHHPLSLLVLRIDKIDEEGTWQNFDSLQRDMLKRFAIAKISQIISDMSRQTDIVLTDRGGQFVILCPETDLKSLAIFAERIRTTAAETLGSSLAWGSASFPDEALTFEDLLQAARRRLVSDQVPSALENVQTPATHD